MRIENKVVVVTGGGSGLGRELVLQLLSKDARVMDFLYRMSPDFAAGLIDRMMKRLL